MLLYLLHELLGRQRVTSTARPGMETICTRSPDSQQALESCFCKPQTPSASWVSNKNHQCSAILGRNKFILRYILFLKKDILAACNRNVNQRVNLPVRPWPALPMLTQDSWDKKKKPPERSKIQTVHLYTGCLAGGTFYTAVHAWDN